MANRIILFIVFWGKAIENEGEEIGSSGLENPSNA